MGCSLNAPTFGCLPSPVGLTSLIATAMAMPTTGTRRTSMVSARFQVLPKKATRRGSQQERRLQPSPSCVNFCGDAGAFAQSRYKPRILSMGIYFDRITSPDALYRAFVKSREGVDWKESVQRYEASVFKNIEMLRRKLLDGSYRQLPFVEFDLSERGKTRHIKSMHISDRIIQRAICDEVLVPILGRGLIYDNGASVEGKGISFARRRLQCHLERFIRRQGADGYVLKGYFSKFFDNIDHELVLKAVAEKIDDPLFMGLLEQLVASFRIDASALSDDEISHYETHPVDLLNFPHSDAGRVFINRSLGIGSQISQILGIFYPTPIDRLVKVTNRCAYYGRYMDDFYVIHRDREFLRDLQAQILDEARRLKLFLNERKTGIVPLKRGFTHLKVKYNVTPTGGIINRLTPDSFTRERRRLKAYSKIVGERMTYREVANAYQSWRGNAAQFQSHRSVQKMDRLYNTLFVQE